MIVNVPAAELTLTGPVPTATLTLRRLVPAARLTLSSAQVYVSGGSELAETRPIRLFVGGVEIGGVEWSVQTEEVLGGPGRASLVVQDRANSSWEPGAHDDVRIVIASSGWVLFHGEIVSTSLDLPPQFPWRRWSIACRDRNAELDERLLGAPSGAMWWRASEQEENFRAIDADAISGGTDLVTVQDWLGHYLTGVETGSYVFEHIDNTVLGDPAFTLVLYDSTTTVRSALDSLASIADVNVQFWIDPDDKFHWQEIPSARDLLDTGTADDLDAAPAEIGPGGAGAMALSATWDGQTMPELLYVQGATTFAYDLSTGVAIGGSGWVAPGAVSGTIYGPDPTLRQAYLSAPVSWSEARRNAIAAAALRRAANPTLRGSVRIQGVDGWRAGQVVTINDARLPNSAQGSHLFVVQRVSSSLYPTTDVREYTIDFGDGAVSRISSGGRYINVQAGEQAQQPISSWVADSKTRSNTTPEGDDTHISAGEAKDITFTPINGKGEPWGPAGMPVFVTMRVRVGVETNDLGVLGDDVTNTCGATLDPASGVTDQDGKFRTVLTASATDGLVYELVCKTPLSPAL